MYGIHIWHRNTGVVLRRIPAVGHSMMDDPRTDEILNTEGSEHAQEEPDNEQTRKDLVAISSGQTRNGKLVFATASRDGTVDLWLDRSPPESVTKL